MDISVVLCSYNRCQSLKGALESIAVQNLPDFVEWEVLVVDNNSNDQTRVVVEGFCSRYPGQFRYVFEPQTGLSRARNAGIREARGDVLAFTDDDVTVDVMWLHNLTSALRGGRWAGAGGRILPPSSFSPPRWLALTGPYSMGGALYAHFDLGATASELDCAPHGANMAYQKQMFNSYGGFRTDLGRSAGCMLSNEDTEFGRRLLAAGERLRYEPSAVVYHRVPENRIHKEYLLAWWFNYGRSAIREVGKRPDFLRIPRYYFSIPKGVAGTLLTALQWMLALNPQRRFFLKALVWYLTGQVLEIYQQACKGERADQSAL